MRPNVPKAWFLVLGCNRQDGKGGGWLETTQRLKQRASVRNRSWNLLSSSPTLRPFVYRNHCEGDLSDKEEEGDRCPMPRQDMGFKRLSKGLRHRKAQHGFKRRETRQDRCSFHLHFQSLLRCALPELEMNRQAVGFLVIKDDSISQRPS